MIDNVYVTCSSIYDDKWSAHQVVSDLWGVPIDKLVRYPFKLESHTVPTDMIDVAQMMVADGFEGFKWFYDNRSYWYSPLELAKCWTMISLLRDITARNESAIIMTDSVYFSGYHFSDAERWIGRGDVNGIALTHGFDLSGGGVNVGRELVSKESVQKAIDVIESELSEIGNPHVDLSELRDLLNVSINDDSLTHTDDKNLWSNFAGSCGAG